MNKLLQILEIIWKHHDAVDQILHMLHELFPDTKPEAPKE